MFKNASSSRTHPIKFSSLQTGATEICSTYLSASLLKRTQFRLTQRARVEDYKTSHLREYIYTTSRNWLKKKLLKSAFSILILVNVVLLLFVLIHLISRRSVHKIISASNVKHILNNEPFTTLNQTAARRVLPSELDSERTSFPSQITLGKTQLIGH